MSRKNNIKRKIQTLNRELVHIKHNTHSHFGTGGKVEDASKLLKKLQDDIEVIQCEIKDLEIEYYNSPESKKNMYQVIGYICDLMKGLEFVMTKSDINFKGTYSYIMRYSVRINDVFIRSELDFLKLLYNAEVLIDENTIQINIHPFNLDKELFSKDNFQTYKMSIRLIIKFKL